MAHVAELNENNEVIRVIVVHNDYEDSVEEWATQWANGGNWKQTSYNNKIRKNYAGIGYTYDPQRDAFIPPKPICHSEVKLNEESCLWECANDEHKA